MKNVELWQPTKFVQTSRGLRASRNPSQVGLGSRFIADRIAQTYERAIRAHARARLLDLGCGHVPLYAVYRDLITENICVDWENTIHANPFLDQAVDLNKSLPFPDGAFDTVVMTDVLEHLAEPEAAMREVGRVLREQGKLILGVPFFYWLHEEPHDYYRYTEHALRRFSDLAKLRVVHLEPYGGLPEILLDLTSKGLGLLPRSIAALLRPFHTLAALTSGTPLCRKFSDWSKSSFPLGYILVAEARQT